MPEEEMSAFRGVTRRQFLTFCSGVAALIGFAGPAGTAQVAQALESLAKRPSVVWSSFQQCTGCAMSLLQTRQPGIAELILQQVSLDYQDNVMAAAGEQAEKSFTDATSKKGEFFWVIEGSIPTKIPTAMTVAGKNATDIAKDVYPNAKGVIATGSCACFGNVQAADPNPTGAKGVRDYLREDGGIPDAAVINLPRCPGNGEDLVTALAYVLVNGKLPDLDSEGRPVFLYGATIHDGCFRRGHFEAGEFAESYNDARIGEGWCLYKLGCKGPVTYAPCGVTEWNGKTSWCVHNNPCIGCSERDFWDKATPFTQQLPNLGPFPAQTVGVVLGAATVVGIGAHLVGSIATGRLGKTGDEAAKGGQG